MATMPKTLPLLALLLMAPAVRAEPEDEALATVKRLGREVERDDSDPARPVVGICLGFIQIL